MLVFYDSECGLCAWVLGWILRWDRAQRLRPVAIQSEEGARRLAQIPLQRRLASWHACDERGVLASGGAALAPLLRRLPGGSPLATLVSTFPRASASGYEWIAAHRAGLGRLVPAASKRRARALIARRMH